MTKNKPTLPPRKWYSLQQAADKLTQIFNQPITSGDLLHYANQGLIELSVRIDFEHIGDNEFNFSIHNSNLNEVLEEIYDLDIHCWQGYIGKTNFIKTDRFTAELKDTFDFEKAFKKLQDDSLNSEMGLVDANTFFSEINNESIPIYDAYINNQISLDIKTNIEKLNGFFAIEFDNFEKIFIDENNPKINLKSITFRPSRNDNINNGFGFVIEGMDYDCKQIIELNKDSIFIVPEELELFSNGGKPLRNLNSFESFIEEWKNPTRTMKPDSVAKENVLVETETLKIFELKRVPYFNQTDAQNEESFNTPPSKNKAGRKRNVLYSEIIETATKLFEKYPSSNKESIVNALYKILPDINNLSAQTIRRYLDENKIGKKGGESISSMSL
ncbi:hypothetical protein [Rodentibacter caecimuris]|uniref:hypothetical protein n=1 Tax=Rodentibacter caecimuris TaxID=1796644 RepID=UPI00211A43A1|nr:hypothetical protein [Rodentibacter heylii]MCQ9124249.1 hypothetical protein [Rodentibacter heylii]